MSESRMKKIIGVFVFSFIFSMCWTFLDWRFNLGVKHIEGQHVLSGKYPPITINDHEYSKLEVYYYSDPIFSSESSLKFNVDDGVESEVNLGSTFSDISHPYVFKATCEHGGCVYSLNTSILDVISDAEIKVIITIIGGRVNNDVSRRKGLGVF